MQFIRLATRTRGTSNSPRAVYGATVMQLDVHARNLRRVRYAIQVYARRTGSTWLGYASNVRYLKIVGLSSSSVHQYAISTALPHLGNYIIICKELNRLARRIRSR